MTQNTKAGAKGSKAQPSPLQTLNAVQQFVATSLEELDHDQASDFRKLLEGNLTQQDAEDFVSGLMLQNQRAMDIYAAYVEYFVDGTWEAREIGQHIGIMITEQLIRDQARERGGIMSRPQNLEGLLQVQRFLAAIG